MQSKFSRSLDRELNLVQVRLLRQRGRCARPVRAAHRRLVPSRSSGWVSCDVCADHCFDLVILNSRFFFYKQFSPGPRSKVLMYCACRSFSYIDRTSGIGCWCGSTASFKTLKSVTSLNPRDEPSWFRGFGITMTGALYGDELGRMNPLASILSMSSLRCGTKCTGVL